MVFSKRLLIFALFLGVSGCVLDSGVPLSSRTLAAVDLVPEDARAIAFADASSMMENIEAILAMDPTHEARPAWDKALEMLATLDLDPREDIEFVLMYASEGHEPVVTAVGTFNAEEIGRLLAQEAPAAKSFSGSGLDGWTMSDGERGALAITENGRRLLVGKDQAALEAAASVRGGAPLAALGSPVMGHDAWFIIRDIPTIGRDQTDLPQEAELLARSVETIAAGGTLTAEEASGTAVLHPREGISAKDLAAVVRGAIGALRLQELPADVRAQLEGIDVEQDGDMVVVSGAVDLDILKRLMH